MLVLFAYRANAQLTHRLETRAVARAHQATHCVLKASNSYLWHVELLNYKGIIYIDGMTDWLDAHSLAIKLIKAAC